MLAELAAFIYLNGAILFSGNRKVRFILRPRMSAARRVLIIIKNLYSINVGIYVRKTAD